MKSGKKPEEKKLLHNQGKYEKERIIIELKDVSKVYDMGKGNIVKALQNLSMHVHKGEHISILGPSGSGNLAFGRDNWSVKHNVYGGDGENA